MQETAVVAGSIAVNPRLRWRRERGATVPPHMSADTARAIKEQHCYVCSDKDKVHEACSRYTAGLSDMWGVALCTAQCRSSCLLAVAQHAWQ